MMERQEQLKDQRMAVAEEKQFQNYLRSLRQRRG
jgi:hypothetical protein